jgi:4-hydroxythreonine-4-phosphate dehydrogenase
VSLPLLLTCGDPSGIGPEIAAKAWASGVRFVWLGDPRHLPEGTDWRPAIEGEAPEDGPLPVLCHDFPAMAVPGHPNPANAASVIGVIARAVALVRAGKASGLCTAPINKKALKDGAGFAFPGHTEFLADLAGVPRVVMMLACPLLHIPLADVPAMLTTKLLEETIRITHSALIRDFGITLPRLVVAGLNPHAGEGGTMGREEVDRISPLVDRLAADGMQVRGPLSADTMFHPGARAGYDAAICMYHDQALIPIKTLDFAGGVNVTLGLPFVRTSPDHGTAYDIAGRGVADPTSLIAALRMASEMMARR